MELHKYSDKKVRLITHNGKVFEGIAYDFIPPQDNPDGIASISIGDYEFSENHIKSIDVIE